MMFFVIVLEMRGFVRPYGLRSSSSSLGSSVARAREARVSMIRFTHNIWMAFRGLSWKVTINAYFFVCFEPLGFVFNIQPISLSSRNCIFQNHTFLKDLKKTITMLPFCTPKVLKMPQKF